MATYQEQIERNKQLREGEAKQLMVDLAMLSKVHEAGLLLMHEGLITNAQLITMLRKYIDLHPGIKKIQQMQFEPQTKE